MKRRGKEMKRVVGKSVTGEGRFGMNFEALETCLRNINIVRFRV